MDLVRGAVAHHGTGQGLDAEPHRSLAAGRPRIMPCARAGTVPLLRVTMPCYLGGRKKRPLTGLFL